MHVGLGNKAKCNNHVLHDCIRELVDHVGAQQYLSKSLATNMLLLMSFIIRKTTMV